MTTTANCKPQTECKKYDDCLSLDNTVIKYNPRYRVNCGTLSQLLFHLIVMSKEVSNINTNNIFQAELFPYIKKICNALVKEYRDHLELVAVSEEQKRIFAYFICGSRFDGGMFKPTKNKAEMKTYDHCELGLTLRTMKDRLYHMGRMAEKRSQMKQYQSDRQTYLFLKGFASVMGDIVEKRAIQWKNLIASYRKNNITK